MNINKKESIPLFTKEELTSIKDDVLNNITSEKSILWGKVGRTWTGFIRDWLATLGLISDSNLDRRWDVLSKSSFKIISLKNGYVDPAFFTKKIKEQLKEKIKNKLDTCKTGHLSEEEKVIIETNLNQQIEDMISCQIVFTLQGYL